MSLEAWLVARERFEKVTAATEKGMDTALKEIGITFHRMLVEKLSQPGSGATYSRGGRTHTASAPGEPPAVDFGQYRGSWAWEVVTAEHAVDIFTDQERGPSLEFGTMYMEPRPHLRPVAEAMAGPIRDIVVKNIEAEQGAAIQKGTILMDTFIKF